MSQDLIKKKVNAAELGPTELPMIGGDLVQASDQDGMAYTSWQDEFVRSPVEQSSGPLSARWQGVQRGASQRTIGQGIPALKEARDAFWRGIRQDAGGAQAGIMVEAARAAAAEHVSVSGGLKRAIGRCLYEVDEETQAPAEGPDGLPKLKEGFEAKDIRSLANALKILQEVDFAATGVLTGQGAPTGGIGLVDGANQDSTPEARRVYTLLELTREVQSGGEEMVGRFTQLVMAAGTSRGEARETAALLAGQGK